MASSGNITDRSHDKQAVGSGLGRSSFRENDLPESLHQVGNEAWSFAGRLGPKFTLGSDSVLVTFSVRTTTVDPKFVRSQLDLLLGNTRCAHFRILLGLWESSARQDS